MFNIIETARNYVRRELLRDNLSSDVALHFNVKSLATIFGGKLFGGNVLPANYCSCALFATLHISIYLFIYLLKHTHYVQSDKG